MVSLSAKALVGAALLMAPVVQADDLAGQIVEVGNTLVSAMMVRCDVGSTILYLHLAADVSRQDEQGVHPGQDRRQRATNQWPFTLRLRLVCVSDLACPASGLDACHRDLESRTATPMDVQTNPFCANGMHLPNGSFVVFGGNNAVGPGGDNHISGSTTAFDPTYQDHNGTYAIRVLTPCDGDVDSDSACAWFDSPNSGLHMQSGRWYPGAEALGNGSVIIIGMQMPKRSSDLSVHQHSGCSV